MKDSTLTTNNALLKMTDLKLKMLLENDLRDFKMAKQTKTDPAKVNQAIAA